MISKWSLRALMISVWSLRTIVISGCAVGMMVINDWSFETLHKHNSSKSLHTGRELTEPTLSTSITSSCEKLESWIKCRTVNDIC